MILFPQNIKTSAALFLLVFGYFFFSPAARAATFYFNPPHSDLSINDEFAIDLMLDPDGESINALSGSISFPSDIVSFIRAENGDSIVNLWLEFPALDAAGSLSFSGLIPGGFDGKLEPYSTSVSAGKILTLIFETRGGGREGQIFLTDAAALLHDGAGTPAQISLVPALLGISDAAGFKHVVHSDAVPPEPFTFSIESHPDLFSGRYYLVFFTQDKDSGINHYEVCESRSFSADNPCAGRWSVAVSPYVLRDQTLRSIIKVKAIDNAGRESVSEQLPPETDFQLFNFNFLTLIILAAVFILIILSTVFRKKT